MRLKGGGGGRSQLGFPASQQARIAPIQGMKRKGLARPAERANGVSEGAVPVSLAKPAAPQA